MTDIKNDTIAQQAQGEAERRAVAPQEENGGFSFSGAIDGISSFFGSSRSFFQGSIKGGVSGLANYGDSVVDSVDEMRDLATNKSFETVESFVFGLFSWDWGKDFSFSKNYDSQKSKASDAWGDIGKGFYTSGAELLPTKLLEFFGVNSQQITTPEQEAAANGQEAAKVAMFQSQNGNGK